MLSKENSAVTYAPVSVVLLEPDFAAELNAYSPHPVSVYCLERFWVRISEALNQSIVQTPTAGDNPS